MGPLSSPSRNSNNGTPTRATSHPLVSKPANRLLNFSPEKPTHHLEPLSQDLSSSELNKGNAISTSGKKKDKRKRKRVFDLTGRSGGVDDPEADAMDGQSLTSGIINDEESMVISGINDQDESQISVPLPEQPRRGRPPKKAQVYQDPDTNLPSATSPVPAAKRHPPPSQRDPNVRKNIAKTVHGKPPSRAGSIAAGPRFVQRSETPANDSGALITRFGRQSIKPLATWRGEKTVMGDRTFDTLPGIKEVIRVDEIVESRPKQRYRKGRSRPKSRLADVEEDEIEEEKAPWELDPGIMVAQVMEWDPDANNYEDQSTSNEGMSPLPLSLACSLRSLTLADVAYSHEAIQMRDIKGADFKFAKTLTLDFFGSGMVQLPPGGAKRIKNSRKMQMVFFVFYGRVTVNVGTPPTKFSIGKGGQWQVPRGKVDRFLFTSDQRYTKILENGLETDDLVLRVISESCSTCCKAEISALLLSSYGKCQSLGPTFFRSNKCLKK